MNSTQCVVERSQSPTRSITSTSRIMPLRLVRLSAAPVSPATVVTLPTYSGSNSSTSALSNSRMLAHSFVSTLLLGGCAGTNLSTNTLLPATVRDEEVCMSEMRQLTDKELDAVCGGGLLFDSFNIVVQPQIATQIGVAVGGSSVF